MIRTLSAMLTIAALPLFAAGEKKILMKDLPPAVQAAVRSQLKGAKVTGISEETEKGVRQYEVETLLNGKHRDFNVDTKGALLTVEEETSIHGIPGAARSAIEKKAKGGKLGMVEMVSEGGSTYYEASYTGKDGKKHEVLVKPDGSEAKE